MPCYLEVFQIAPSQIGLHLLVDRANSSHEAELKLQSAGCVVLRPARRTGQALLGTLLLGLPRAQTACLQACSRDDGQPTAHLPVATSLQPGCNICILCNFSFKVADFHCLFALCMHAFQLTCVVSSSVHCTEMAGVFEEIRTFIAVGP